MKFYAKWSQKESLSEAEVEFLARRLLETNERYALAEMLKRYDMGISVFADVLAGDNAWHRDMLSDAAPGAGQEFQRGWLEWYAGLEPGVQRHVASRLAARYEGVEESFIQELWDLGSSAARVALLDSTLRRGAEETSSEFVEWLAQAWRTRSSAADPIELSHADRLAVRLLIDTHLSPSEACELLKESCDGYWSHIVWARLVREGTASDLTDSAAAFLAQDALGSITKRHVRSLVGTPEFEAAVALARRLEEDDLLLEALRKSASQIRGWDGSALPTEALIRSRAEVGLVDEATFLLLARTEADDPLRAALAHKSATAKRVAGLARAEDLTGVLAEKPYPWRTELMRQVWKHSEKHGSDEVRTELFRALAREHTREELAELLEVGGALVEETDLTALVAELGIELAGPVLDRLTLTQLNSADDVVVEAMLEQLHSELGASPEALETFHALSEGFEGSFKELVSTCAELL
jgi:hypothetical protein